ncbi:MAG: adhesin, partial [Erysipelotrichaceae bacterium]
KVNANYDTPLGFRHGPKSVVDDTTTTIIYISNDEYTRKYDLDLTTEMIHHRKNDKVVVVGCNIDKEIKEKADYTFELDLIDYSIANEALLSMQQIIFGQMLSFLKSMNLSITPDNPCPTGEVNRVVQGVTLHSLV